MDINKPKRSIKGVTTASATGGTLGVALAQLLIHAFPYLEGAEAALSVVLTAVLGLLGGYLVPPSGEETETTTETVYEIDYDEDYEPGKHALEYDEDAELDEIRDEEQGSGNYASRPDVQEAVKRQAREENIGHSQ